MRTCCKSESNLMNKRKILGLFLFSFLLLNIGNLVLAEESSGLEWGIEIGDTVNYVLKTDLDVELSNSSVFAELNSYLNDTRNISVDSMAIYENLIEEVNDEITMNMVVQNMTCEEMLINTTEYYETYLNEKVIVEFDPLVNDTMHDKLDNMINILNSSGIITENQSIDLMDDLSMIFFNDFNFNVSTILDIDHLNQRYTHNDTLHENQTTTFSSLNISDISTMIPFVLPLDFNLTEAKEIFFDQFQSEITDPTLENATLLEMLDLFGINETSFDEKSFSYVFKNSDIHENYTFLPSESLLQDFNVSVAVIYDANMVLESLTLFSDFTLTLNITDLTEGEIEVDVFEMTIAFDLSFSQIGSTLPSEDDISNGELVKVKTTYDTIATIILISVASFFAIGSGAYIWQRKSGMKR